MDRDGVYFQPIQDNSEESGSLNNYATNKSEHHKQIYAHVAFPNHLTFRKADQPDKRKSTHTSNSSSPRNVRYKQSNDDVGTPEAEHHPRKHAESISMETTDLTSSAGSMNSIQVTSPPSSSKAGNSQNNPMSPTLMCSPQRFASSSRSSTQNSKVRRSLNSSLSEAVCRICHGSGSSEQLFSPCYCSGSIGLLHVSCLQRWLGSSNKSCCELCHFQFKLERRPKPFRMFLKNPGRRRDKRHLICDIVCFALLGPSTIATSYLCIVGSRMYDATRVEAILLYCLTIALITLFSAWTMMCLRQNYALWKEWKQFNQDVKIICEPSDYLRIGNSPEDRDKLQRVKLCSIKIKVSTDLKSGSSKTTTSLKQTKQRGQQMIQQHPRLTESNIACSLAKSNTEQVHEDKAFNSQSVQNSSHSSKGDEHMKYGRSYWSNQRNMSKNEFPSSQFHVSGRQKPHTAAHLNGLSTICVQDTYI